MGLVKLEDGILRSRGEEGTKVVLQGSGLWCGGGQTRSRSRGRLANSELLMVRLQWWGIDSGWRVVAVQCEIWSAGWWSMLSENGLWAWALLLGFFQVYFFSLVVCRLLSIISPYQFLIGLGGLCPGFHTQCALSGLARRRTFDK